MDSLGGVGKLAQYGMHFDELNRIRVLDEATASQVNLFSSLNQFFLNGPTPESFIVYFRSFQTYIITIFQQIYVQKSIH